MPVACARARGYPCRPPAAGHRAVRRVAGVDRLDPCRADLGPRRRRRRRLLRLPGGHPGPSPAPGRRGPRPGRPDPTVARRGPPVARWRSTPPTTDERFDVALCVYVIEHVEAPGPFLEAVRSLLRGRRVLLRGDAEPVALLRSGQCRRGPPRNRGLAAAPAPPRRADRGLPLPVRYRCNTIRQLRSTALDAGFRGSRVPGPRAGRDVRDVLPAGTPLGVPRLLPYDQSVGVTPSCTARCCFG